MDSSYYKPIISEETFASWLDGTMSYEQEAMFLKACSNDEDLQELLEANDQIDEDYENMIDVGYDLPYEFNTDFDLPHIDYSNEDDDIYSYEEIEPYEQDDDNSEDSINNEEGEPEDENNIDNYTLSDIDNDEVDLM